MGVSDGEHGRYWEAKIRLPKRKLVRLGSFLADGENAEEEAAELYDLGVLAVYGWCVRLLNQKAPRPAARLADTAKECCAGLRSCH